MVFRPMEPGAASPVHSLGTSLAELKAEGNELGLAFQLLSSNLRHTARVALLSGCALSILLGLALLFMLSSNVPSQYGILRDLMPAVALVLGYGVACQCLAWLKARQVDELASIAESRFESDFRKHLDRVAEHEGHG